LDALLVSSLLANENSSKLILTPFMISLLVSSFMDENNNIKKMAMGDLFDSLVGTGFHGKRKRLPTSNRRKMSHFSRFANFGMTSIVDIESSE
jgi:hypothetical protein